MPPASYVVCGGDSRYPCSEVRCDRRRGPPVRNRRGAPETSLARLHDLGLHLRRFFALWPDVRIHGGDVRCDCADAHLAEGRTTAAVRRMAPHGLRAGVLHRVSDARLAEIQGSISIKQRRSRTFYLVLAAISCLEMPYGTVLGVFTFIVLGRDSIARQFEPHKIPVPAA